MYNVYHYYTLEMILGTGMAWAEMRCVKCLDVYHLLNI